MDFFWLVQLLIPVSICVVLPIIIVLIVFRSRNNKVNKMTEIVMKSIENNSSVDTDRLLAALGTQGKTPQMMQQQRLLRGCIFTLCGLVLCLIEVLFGVGESFAAFAVSGVLFAIGISYLIVYFVSRPKTDCTKPEE